MQREVGSLSGQLSRLQLLRNCSSRLDQQQPLHLAQPCSPAATAGGSSGGGHGPQCIFCKKPLHAGPGAPRSLQLHPGGRGRLEFGGSKGRASLSCAMLQQRMVPRENCPA